MTTISETIRKIANIYKEPEAGPMLSGMDFQALDALYSNPDACRMIPGSGFEEEAICLEEREKAYAKDPDGFIAQNLGNPGDAFRQYEERKAEALCEAAKKYETSEEPYSSGSAFQRDIDAVEVHFRRVLESYGEYAFRFPFADSRLLRGMLLSALDAVL